MKTIVLIGAILLSATIISDQPNRILAPEMYEDHIDNIRDTYGKNKVFLEDLEVASLIALTFYPELVDTKIQFKRSNIKTTMATRPTMGSAMKNKSKRLYTIHVDNDLVGNDGLVVDDQIPFNALVGLIGHEYAHILDYESMSMWQITKMGSKYSSKKFKMALERKIDRVTINRGLGWQLRDWAEYSMETCNASSAYKAFKKRTYLNKNQIVDFMEQNETYDQSFLNESRN